MEVNFHGLFLWHYHITAPSPHLVSRTINGEICFTFEGGGIVIRNILILGKHIWPI